MQSKLLTVLFLLCSLSCKNNSIKAQKDVAKIKHAEEKFENYYKSINEINLPQGFTRVHTDDNSFESYLQHLPLKKDKTVYTFSGAAKTNQTAQFAVVDVTVGDKNLQQCADALMRLRAEFLFIQKRFNEIVFFDNDGKKYGFTLPYTREHFMKYLETVFGMCGTASLSKQLKQVNNISDIKIGDVFIRGGFPGHAVIVVDVAKNNEGEKIYLLAQSYMPAQDIHVLVNQNNTETSPWYLVNGNDEFVYTPEYTFKVNELKQWQ